ncbi:MAG: ribosome maturation factor RimP [Gemmatimonadota bacterium]
MRVVPEIADELERRVAALGFELVEVRWGGTGKRPLLKLRIDRPASDPVAGVTVDDCASVSRALESWLDEHARLSERYTLEVSSPGVDRPLVKPGDFERFRGERVVVQGKDPLVGDQRRIEGELLGWEEAGEGGGSVRLRLPEGDEVGVPLERIRKANLVFTWK